MRKGSRAFAVVFGLAPLAGCVKVLPPEPAVLFSVPLSIDGKPVDAAIVDTGGEYDVILRQAYGLQIVGKAHVLAFDGPESVDVTRGFNFTAGGIDSTADLALVGLSVCDCNGVGFQFFRKERTVLAIDFGALNAGFQPNVPTDGLHVDFAKAPEGLADFDSSFVDVFIQANAGDTPVHLTALFDTGTNITILRRGILIDPFQLSANLQGILIHHPMLGTVSVTATLFDTPGLPDMVIGTDVMSAWGQRWYFSYNEIGGTTVVIPWPDGESTPSANSQTSATAP
ncbi:MAG: hypothetical protein HY287_02735 [Planctomycetes bacterium]|nr:hypothetical protein [Planctomycetota bacterium]MBI3833227.1 hypothetical protein [Planctomycetota bacterium]